MPVRGLPNVVIVKGRRGKRRPKRTPQPPARRREQQPDPLAAPAAGRRVPPLPSRKG